ncbi:MAG: hypothetical protein IJ583_13475 [Firmicutes bacterium]|nr:hypothetical protein [Bacillota bacterium]
MIDIKQCAELLADKIPGAAQIYKEHLNDYNEINLHILVGDIINEPLTKLLGENKQRDLIKIYCDTIERMWRYGDEYVKNVVDVTILEYISGRDEEWQIFGSYVTDGFKNYINKEYVPFFRSYFKIVPFEIFL